MQKQLRAIARLPAHITHVRNQAVVEQLQICEPGARVLRNMEGQLQRWNNNLASDNPIPIEAEANIGQLRQQLVDGLSAQLQLEHRARRSMLTCPHCALECVNKTVLGSRISQKHTNCSNGFQSSPAFFRWRITMLGMPALVQLIGQAAETYRAWSLPHAS